jgi:CubicO group peptidase (beta-lactamase class C family)
VNSLPRSTPEAQGVSPDTIREFLGALEAFGGVYSAMVLRHGQVIAEQWWAPGAPDVPHHMWSLSKSFTSTAVGILIGDGKLALTDRIVDLLPDAAPAEIDAHLAALTVRDLLTMTTGHAQESLPEEERRADVDWATHILGVPLAHVPGTTFVYNSGATYLLSTIVQRLSRERLLDYLTPRLFEPLGITGPTWAQSPQGIDIGGWGLSIVTEDIAKFGQLYLQGGVWNDQQLVPDEWVREATSAQVPNAGPESTPDWSQGYGYQFWQCRHGAFRGDGKDGQFCIVMPEQDVVVALTSNLTDMQGELDLVWKHLLPGLH